MCFSCRVLNVSGLKLVTSRFPKQSASDSRKNFCTIYLQIQSIVISLVNEWFKSKLLVLLFLLNIIFIIQNNWVSINTHLTKWNACFTMCFVSLFAQTFPNFGVPTVKHINLPFICLSGSRDLRGLHNNYDRENCEIVCAIDVSKWSRRELWTASRPTFPAMSAFSASCSEARGLAFPPVPASLISLNRG